MNRLPLRAMEAFVAAARSCNLTHAAAQLNLTLPAVSRRIQILEQHLGTALFQRLPRGLRLTEAGAAFFTALAPGWDAMQAAAEEARQRARRRPVRVSVIPTFAANWLLPRLARFHARHPAVEIAIETEADVVDLQARPDLDCAIRLGRGPWPGLASQILLPVDAYPVASPAFIRRAGPLATPDDLLRHTLIGSSHQPDFWPEWLAGAGIAAAPPRYRDFDNLQLVHEAAAAGMGIGIGLDPVVRPYLDNARLVRVLPTEVRLSRMFHLVRRKGDQPGGHDLGRFCTWLLQAARAA